MGKTIDLTGQHFGEWTVLRKSDKKTANRQTYWVCQCSCGTIRDVCGGNLRNGKSTNCGCIRKQTLQKIKSKDITGQRFGRLVALQPTEQRQNQNVIWKCKCDCGNITYVPTNSLTSGNTQSCGCLHKDFLLNQLHPNLINQKFYHLTVLQKAGIDKNGKQLWECECDCINHTHIIVPTSSLTSGNTQSCGCQKSRGETQISYILNNHSIKFQTQKIFETCRFPDTNALAKFDFYINNQYLIEYDGIQHFKESTLWKNFEKTKEHDIFKNQWCKENNIPLIRIPYTHLNDLKIEDLLLETSEFII